MTQLPESCCRAALVCPPFLFLWFYITKQTWKSWGEFINKFLQNLRKTSAIVSYLPQMPEQRAVRAFTIKLISRLSSDLHSRVSS